MSKFPFVIAVEGINAVGKTHTINALKGILTEMKVSHACYKAPDYQGLHGEVITSFL